MVALAQLNRTARRFAAALVRDFPQFAPHLSTLPDGHFSAEISAPPRSKARAIRCLSTRDGDLWIQLALRNAFYSVDSVPEMRSVLRAFFTDAVGFVLISRNRRWTGTTLVKLDVSPSLPMLRVGERARVISWSGTHDHIVRSSTTKARPSRVKRVAPTGRPLHRAG